VAGIEAVDPRYLPIVERAREVFAGDERVVRVEPGGSIGSDEADAWSDLDLHVYTRDADHGAVVAEWPTWLPKIATTVFARTPILPFIINTVTTDGLTLDVVVFPESTPPFTRPEGYSVGLISGQRFADQAPAVEYAVAEMFRCLCGPFITDFGRREFVRPMIGTGHLLGLLTTVMLAETESPPPSAKTPSADLTDEQRAALAALPPLHATTDSATTFTLAVAGELTRRARPLLRRYGIDWPEELERTARARVKDVTGLEWT
jgi:hypothetical protein